MYEKDKEKGAGEGATRNDGSGTGFNHGKTLSQRRTPGKKILLRVLNNEDGHVHMGPG
jgi:hypothetical protein